MELYGLEIRNWIVDRNLAFAKKDIIIFSCCCCFKITDIIIQHSTCIFLIVCRCDVIPFSFHDKWYFITSYNLDDEHRTCVLESALQLIRWENVSFAIIVGSGALGVSDISLFAFIVWQHVNVIRNIWNRLRFNLACV